MYKTIFLVFTFLNSSLQFSSIPNNFINNNRNTKLLVTSKNKFINNYKNYEKNLNILNTSNNLIHSKIIKKNVNRANNIKCLESTELCNIIDKILQYKLTDDITLGRILVEQISAILPKVDSIGHNILSANDKFILYILKNPNLSEEIQKNIILSSIRLAQTGDDFGSTLLQLYYDIVDKSL